MNEVATRPAIVTTFAEKQALADAVVTSGMYQFKNPAQVLVLMALAEAEGRHPALVMRDYDIIQGRPAKKSEAMLRDFIASGGKIRWEQLDDEAADAVFSHPGSADLRIRWDTKRAKQAGLAGKEMWQKYPRQMLRSRCISEGIRTIYPAATSGMYVPEELRDITPEKPEKTKPEPKSPQAVVEALDAFGLAPVVDHDPETGEITPPPEDAHFICPHPLPIDPDAVDAWVKARVAEIQETKTSVDLEAWLDIYGDEIEKLPDARRSKAFRFVALRNDQLRNDESPA